MLSTLPHRWLKLSVILLVARLVSVPIGSLSLSVSNWASSGFFSGECQFPFRSSNLNADDIQLDSLANSQSSPLLQTAYYDPFQPHVFHLPTNPYSSDSALHPDTIALFTPFVSSHNSWSGLETTASLLKGVVERGGRFAEKWIQSQTFQRGGKVIITGSRSVPV